jgi:Fe-S cluster assembly protein SufD
MLNAPEKMLELTEKPHSLIENHQAVRGILGTYGPASLQEMRDRSLREFMEAGIPTTKDEEWKYTSLRIVEEGQFKPAYGATVYREEIEATALGNIDGLTLTFVNGEHAPELSTEHALPAGVIVSSLRDALESHEELVLQHLGSVVPLTGKLGSTNDQRFVSLNTAYLSEGAFVYVPRGAAVQAPIHLLFVNRADHGPFVAHPRVLIVVEDGAEAKVLESYVGLEGVYFTNAVTEVWLGERAILEHTRYQHETGESVHIAAISAHQEADSVYTSNNTAFGARIARTDLNVWVNGEHAETWLNGAYLGLGEQVIDNHTRIDHAVPNCNSFEVYKGILGGRAVGVFNGKIFVYEDAQKTDAKQTNQAILLSPTATINTKPQLEIFADDVKCTHGATVGQLREDARFYLRTRGIPAKQAQALLVYAFAAEVLEKISIVAVRDALEKVLFDRLHETEDLPESLAE